MMTISDVINMLDELKEESSNMRFMDRITPFGNYGKGEHGKCKRKYIKLMKSIAKKMSEFDHLNVKRLGESINKLAVLRENGRIDYNAEDDFNNFAKLVRLIDQANREGCQ